MATTPNAVLRPLSVADWPDVRTFLASEWADDHPLLNKDLFVWQFHGFGPDAGIAASPTVWIGDQLVGMRGVIPGVYQIPKATGAYRLESGCSTAMWMVRSGYRGTGLGHLLWRATSDQFNVRVSLGANEETAVPFYRRSGYRRIDALHHWFYPLESKSFQSLTYGPWEQDDIASKVHRLVGDPVIPQPAQPEQLADMWNHSVRRAAVFGLHRSEDFWFWRYRAHPVFKYLVFGSLDTAGFIVARLEEVDQLGTGPFDSLRVLRLIELVPIQPYVWLGEHDPAFSDLLRGVLRWAQEHGCAAADFRCSSRRFNRSLESVGFYFRENEVPAADGSGFAGLLRPLRLKPKPINAHWDVEHEAGDKQLLEDETYFVKSDSDMDRPNDSISA